MMKRTALKRSTTPMKRAAMKRSSKRKHRIEGHHDQKMLDACRGESCYLLVPGVCRHIYQDETVVDCHGNWADTGKGLGLKAKDKFSVPGCGPCHYWLDVGTTASREVKRIAFFDALARWEPVRELKLLAKTNPATLAGAPGLATASILGAAMNAQIIPRKGA